MHLKDITNEVIYKDRIDTMLANIKRGCFMYGYNCSDQQTMAFLAQARLDMKELAEELLRVRGQRQELRREIKKVRRRMKNKLTILENKETSYDH